MARENWSRCGFITASPVTLQFTPNFSHCAKVESEFLQQEQACGAKIKAGPIQD